MPSRSILFQKSRGTTWAKTLNRAKSGDGWELRVVLLRLDMILTFWQAGQKVRVQAKMAPGFTCKGQ